MSDDNKINLLKDQEIYFAFLYSLSMKLNKFTNVYNMEKMVIILMYILINLKNEKVSMFLKNLRYIK